MEDLRVVVGQRMRAARLNLGLSQQAVARQVARLTAQNPESLLRNLKRYETGRHFPDRYFHRFLAQVLCASEEELFGPIAPPIVPPQRVSSETSSLETVA